MLIVDRKNGFRSTFLSMGFFLPDVFLRMSEVEKPLRKNVFDAVFRIRIRDPPDPLFFLGSGSGSVKK